MVATIPDTIPVLVVGAGPIGLSLAIELRVHGVDVLVVDRDLDIVDGHPKGRGNDLRTLEHYHRWGVSDELRQLSWQTRNPDQKVIITESIAEQPLGAYPLQYGRHVEESREYAAEPSLSLPQPILMRVLQKRAIELGAQIWRGWEATSAQQDIDKAVTELKSLAEGTIHRVSSDYLIGADGPHSLVRKAAGISRKGVGPISRACSYVVRSEGYKIRDMISSPAHDALAFLMVLSPANCTIISIPDDEHWGFSVMVDDNEPDPTDEEVIQAGQNVLGARVPLEVISSSSFRVFTRLADSYSTGRLFIAGDAAHLCPPTGGHNMNLGIGDAVNLAWKLAGVLHGWGGEKLLSSYDAERRPVGDRVTSSAMENSYSMKKVSDIFAELPPLGHSATQGQRCARGDTAYKITYQQWNSLGVTLGQRYDESPLTIKGTWEAPPYSATEYWHYASPGHRAPHVWLEDGTPLLNHFGKGFTLLDVEASDVLVARFLNVAARVGLPITRLRLSVGIARSKYPASITIIRPDQYIAWQGDECNDPASVIDRIRGK
ncbi:hypothetical protein UA08_08428 [Talaromyces atroroseus]|uniref:FAD-binding domain-containing protein n=1 Tax=Talaromyces atroroseus TaxID=1441469 RepID=A0A1Q5Q7K5_TALAT|nr:hypothetical protein UA08_08428 [Talaromyces atroroseus]OKL56205.1 hypothetical protein UA08_08428 [Talaromyces atroroseus]